MLNIYILVSLYLYFINLSVIGLLYIMIYVGAITVLFVFIVSLLNIEFIEKSYTLKVNYSLLILTSILSIYLIFNFNFNDFNNISLFIINDNINYDINTLLIFNNIGHILYSKYSMIIIILGFLLLFSIISCILLLKYESVSKRDIEIIKTH